MDLTLNITNGNQTGHVVTAMFSGPLPSGWSGDLTVHDALKNLYAVLKPLESETFRLFLQPCDTSKGCKPQQLNTISLTGFMNYGDSFIPVSDIPVYVALSNRTKLTLTAKSGNPAILSGKLTFRIEGSNTDQPLKNASVYVVVSASDQSSPRSFTATTTSTGDYSLSVSTQSGVAYRATTQYAGSIEFQRSESSPVEFNPIVRLGVTVTGSGKVTSKPAGINCPGDCTQDYAKNTSVTLTATPAKGNPFKGWGGACTGTRTTCTVKMTTNLAVGATFN